MDNIKQASKRRIQRKLLAVERREIWGQLVRLRQLWTRASCWVIPGKIGLLLFALLTGCGDAYVEAASTRFNSCAIPSDPVEALDVALERIGDAGYRLRSWDKTRWETNTVLRTVSIGETVSEVEDASKGWHELTHVRQSSDSWLTTLAGTQDDWRWAVEVQGMRQNVIVYQAFGVSPEKIEARISSKIPRYGWTGDLAVDALELALETGCE